MVNRWGNNGNSDRIFLGAPKSLWMGYLFLGRKTMINLDNVLESGDYFADKCLYCQNCGFSSSCVWMWEVDNKKDCALTNWCFWTVVLENTLFFFFLMFICLAVQGLSGSSWNLCSFSQHVRSSSLTRDWTGVPCIGSTESWPPDCQGSPWRILLRVPWTARRSIQ